MKRFFSKTLAILMVIALIMSVAAISASAEGETSYTPIYGTTTAMTKNLVMDTDTNVPKISFDYTIVAGSSQTASTSAVEIIPGPVVNDESGKQIAPVIEPATFNGTESTTPGRPNGVAAEGKKYASTTANIDLTGVRFPKPGVYRYNIEERSGGLKGVSYDTSKRYLDVFVIYDKPKDANGAVIEDAEPVLQISNYTLRTSATGINPTTGKYVSNEDEKSAGYTNELSTYDIEFSKAIDGNQADKDKRFTFTLQLTNALPGKYTVEGVEVPSEELAVIEVTAANSTVTKEFHLTNDSSVKVHGINNGAGYTITEDSEDYIASIVTTGTGATSEDDMASGTLNGTDVTAAFTNRREGIVPTGVLLTVAPFAIGLLLFGAIAVFLISKKRREDY